MEEEAIKRIYPPVKKAPRPREYKDKKENKKENNMSDNIITAAKIIAKSVDALTREIYLLRTAKNEGLKTNVDGRSVRDCCVSPPTPDFYSARRPTGCG